MSELFIELMQVAIGKRSDLSRVPAEREWEGLFGMSRTQALTGVCFAAVQTLSSSMTTNLSKALRLRWMAMAAKIQQANELHRRVIVQVSDHLQGCGIEPVFMKGLVCASRYGERLQMLRLPGDIDFVVRPEDFKLTLDALEAIGMVDRKLIHEHHGMAYVDGVALEPHYKLHNFQHPRVDRFAKGLQAWLFAKETRVRKIMVGSAGIPAMPLELEGVFLVSHMVNHVYEEGLGLRQVMDYAFWLMDMKRQDAFDRKQHDEWLRGMRMTRAHRVFVRLCEKYLGVPGDICGYTYSEGEKRFADRLMGDILQVGNFGRGAYVFDHSSRKGEFKNYLWVCRRAVSLHYLCPAEAWMWPLSKATRYFAKRMGLDVKDLAAGVLFDALDK